MSYPGSMLDKFYRENNNPHSKFSLHNNSINIDSNITLNPRSRLLLNYNTKNFGMNMSNLNIFGNRILMKPNNNFNSTHYRGDYDTFTLMMDDPCNKLFKISDAYPENLKRKFDNYYPTYSTDATVYINETEAASNDGKSSILLRDNYIKSSTEDSFYNNNKSILISVKGKDSIHLIGKNANDKSRNVSVKEFKNEFKQKNSDDVYLNNTQVDGSIPVDDSSILRKKYNSDIKKVESINFDEERKYTHVNNSSETTIEILNKIVNSEDYTKINSAVDIKYTKEKEKSKYFEKYKEINEIKVQFDKNKISRAEVIDERALDGIYNVLKHEIPFYFYDLVNKKYIPFLATIKGVSEASQADWSEVKYIGRADKLYNYNGFTRTLNFSFMTYCESIDDLLPMWKKINYLLTLTKPARYIDRNMSDEVKNADLYKSSFIVPPMVKVTIGDMYKNQPLILENISISIPDDAQWETIKEKSEDYNYGKRKDGNIINKSGTLTKIARFPRVCELSVQSKLLEKERPQTGHANWGDAILESASNEAFSNRLIEKNHLIDENKKI